MANLATAFLRSELTRTCAVVLFLAAGTVDARSRALFLFELRGTPVGTVELSLDETSGDYRYTSTQLFTREASTSKRRRAAQFTARDGLREARSGVILQSLFLWRGPRRPGCVQTQEELGGRVGPVCLETVDKRTLRGTVFGDRFEATLDARGELQQLSLGPARFSRVPDTFRLEQPRDVFGAGWEIVGDVGELRLSVSSSSGVAEESAAALKRPFRSVAAAQALAQAVHDSFDAQNPSGADFAHDEAATSASCLGHARRFIARAEQLGVDAHLVQGLFAERRAQTAHGHAWVRVRVGETLLDLDPTWLVPVTRATHLPLSVVSDRGTAGRAWLPLLSGEATVRRVTPDAERRAR